MAKQQVPTIDAESRDRVGTRYSRRLREQGRLPAVMYGHKEEPITISLDAKRFGEIVNDSAHLIEIKLDGKKESCLIREVQWDYLGVKMVHADLARVDMSEQVEVELEVELVGETSALEEAGAVLSQPTTSITVACRADAIPESLQADISEMGPNDTLTVADLKLPDGVAAVSEPETVLATIQVMQELPEEEVPTAEEGEPEVIGEGDQGEAAEESAEEEE